MNSLNLLSARVIGQSSSIRQHKRRSRSLSESTANKETVDVQPPRRSASQHANKVSSADEKERWSSDDEADRLLPGNIPPVDDKEKTPLIEDERATGPTSAKHSKLHVVAKKLVDAFAASVRWILYTLAAPGVYVVTCFYDDGGRFSPFTPIRKLGRVLSKPNGRRSTAQAVGLSGSSDEVLSSSTDADSGPRTSPFTAIRRKNDTADSQNTAINTKSDVDDEVQRQLDRVASVHRPKTQPSSSSEEVPRRSIRIKVYSDDAGRRRKMKRNSKAVASGTDIPNHGNHPAVTAATIKSPTSPASSLRITKYPRAPAPPRPLVPRRQPSYSLSTNFSSFPITQKTLVIDLDETLIHSLAKGGRMSTGHMVEVKLATAVGFNGTTLGPQHPILYYVHKRPHCDDFLRKVCKWYNLVVFTASVQEYADPVIDWLEQERKYFSGRFYRQHCTFRNGAYIKDLSSVEPDLSKVMILDNSPLSYIFHEGEIFRKGPA